MAVVSPSPGAEDDAARAASNKHTDTPLVCCEAALLRSRCAGLASELEDVVVDVLAVLFLLLLMCEARHNSRRAERQVDHDVNVFCALVSCLSQQNSRPKENRIC
eukprot:4926864-Alexandrium_andersonii.AAC.1